MVLDRVSDNARQNNVRRLVSLAATIGLHMVVAFLLLQSVMKFPLQERFESITWLALPEPARDRAVPERRDSPTESGVRNEPLWSLPSVPAPDVQTPSPPDFMGLGRMLNNCKLENFGYLSNLEQQRCAALMVAKPRLTPDGRFPIPYRAENESRWARERAEQNKPNTLPCFGEGGFNPLSPGCLIPDNE